jgi:hypothetical protein
MTFTLVSAYFENAGMMAKQLDAWEAYPDEVKRNLRVVIVDDCSVRAPAEPGIRDVGLAEFRLYRVDTPIAWNWDGARNLAMREIPDGPVLMTDIDHVADAAAMSAAMGLKLKADRYYSPARRKPDGSPYKRHPNSWILQRDLFWRAGGYCEDFAGYYGKDKAFRRQIDTEARRIETDEVVLTLYGRSDIPDASTTDFTRKEGDYYLANHPALRARVHSTHIDRPSSWCRFDWHRVI